MNTKSRIVVADDNREAADTLVEILCAMGYHAVATYDGREAVEACMALRPALAILDVEMPVLDGCSAARIIRATAGPPPAIAAFSGLRHWEKPMKSHADVFDARLAKPARMDQLHELLAKVFGDPCARESMSLGRTWPGRAPSLALFEPRLHQSLRLLPIDPDDLVERSHRVRPCARPIAVL